MKRRLVRFKEFPNEAYSTCLMMRALLQVVSYFAVFFAALRLCVSRLVSRGNLTQRRQGAKMRKVKIRNYSIF